MDDARQPGAGLSLAKMTLAPGALSELHRHPNCTETVHVLCGAIEQRCGEHWTPLRSGETLLITANTAHQTRNEGAEPAVLMIAYSAGARTYQALA